MNYSRIVLCVLIVLSVVSPSHAQLTTYWRLAENQLDVVEGGQINSIAVSPFDPHVMFAASESGGLFKSTSAAAHWIHADKLPVIFTQSVVFLPSDPFSRVVLVSAKADFKTDNGGGVWRSTDGGATWTQTLKDTPGQERMSAYEISVRPGTDTVFVGTSAGAFVSFDGGVTWAPSEVFSGSDKTVFSVMATEGRIFFGGPSGVGTANANLIVETQIIANPIRSMHAFGRRGTTPQVFFVDDSRLLFVSLNGGAGWTRIEHEPEGTGRCGGTPFIKAVDHGAGAPADLYYSNRCGLHKLVAPMVQGIPNYFADDWHEVQVDRGGPRDLALVGTPLLLASTAGVHNQAANGWHLVGGGREGGLNALQINEVKGQLVGQERADLYAGTYENGLWAANVHGDIIGPRRADGHSLELERSVAAGGTSRITYDESNLNQQAARHLFNEEAWLDVPRHRRAPVLLGSCGYVQLMTISKQFHAGMAVTDDCGATWDQFSEFHEQATDIPKVGLVAASVRVVYQSFKSNDGTNRLMRIQKSTLDPDPAAPLFPAMDSSAGGPDVGLGINATGFGGYQVYAPDPASVLHIIAPDVVNGEMRETRNGGETWDSLGQLTSLVRGVDSSGTPQFLFNTDLGGPAAGKVFPIVTAISFFPRFSQLVLIGTSDGGIFASTNNGGAWNRIAGSEKATYITGFFWETANTVYVSTYGRGLWKLSVRVVAPPLDFDVFCQTCNLVSIDPGAGRPPFDGSALVFNGQMLGVRTDHQKLREIFVTPGSSVIFTGDPNDPQDDIAMTESDGRDPSQYEPLPQPKSGIVAGVVFTSDDKLVGVAFAESELTLPQPDPKDPVDVKGSTESPTKGRPYITLTTSASAAVPTVQPMEVFDLSATDFTAGASYEVLVDGTPLKGGVTADGNGSFDTRITAPPDAGYHAVTVRVAGNDAAIERSLFFVRSGN